MNISYICYSVKKSIISTQSQLSQTNMKRQNVPRYELSRCELLSIFGCRLVRLVRFSDTGLISINLDGDPKLRICPKYEPIITLQKDTTFQISPANSIAQNEQNFSIWLWKIRQSAKFDQSDHYNGWRFWDHEPIVTLEGGIIYWISWTDGVAWNGWSSQTKRGIQDNWFWTVQSHC